MTMSDTTSELADRVEAVLDAETHDDLCACRTYPAHCVTYGGAKPWSHSDIHRIVAATLREIAATQQ